MSEPPRNPEPGPALQRRFYKAVTVEAAEASPDGLASAAEAAPHRVLLDGRPMRTPARLPFVVPGRALAEAIAAEWAAQGGRIDPLRMPLTRIANAAIDGVAARRAEVVDDICNYACSDLVCYRAEGPEGLVGRQRRAWDPVLAWTAQRLGVTPRVGSGIVHVAQPAALADAVRRHLAACDAFRLAGLHVATTLTGSALLALALADGGLPAEAAWQAAHVDEDFQIEQWGHDSEAQRRRDFRQAEFRAACVVLGPASAKADRG